jgi:hypothetical protein
VAVIELRVIGFAPRGPCGQWLLACGRLLIGFRLTLKFNTNPIRTAFAARSPAYPPR